MSSADIIKETKGKYSKRGNPWQHKFEKPIYDANGQAVLDEDGNQKIKTELKDWRFYYILVDPTTGKKTHKYKTGFRTKKEAELALAEIKDKLKNKIPIWNQELTLRVYTQGWINDYLPNSGLSPCTVRGYVNNANLHILPALGNYKISSITCRDFERFYLDLYNDGSGLSKNSIKYIKATLISIFNEAYKDKIVLRNEAKISNISHRILPSDFEYVTYSPEQINELLRITKDTNLEVGIALAGVLGFRRGEALGLKYSLIDFDTNRIYVKKQLVFEKKFIHQIVKSGSQRYIYMPDFVKDILLRNKNRQDENRRLLGNEYIENDFVITQHNGNVVRPSTLSRQFSNVLKKNKLPHIRFHDLRHSCNSILYEQNVDKELRKIITGHKTDRMDELYTHVSDNALKNVSSILQNTYTK